MNKIISFSDKDRNNWYQVLSMKGNAGGKAVGEVERK